MIINSILRVFISDSKNMSIKKTLKFFCKWCMLCHMWTSLCTNKNRISSLQNKRYFQISVWVSDYEKAYKFWPWQETFKEKYDIKFSFGHFSFLQILPFLLESKYSLKYLVVNLSQIACNIIHKQILTFYQLDTFIYMK